jgi:predicted SnoaL-like aldol condensation-catalyzing enzyme
MALDAESDRTLEPVQIVEEFDRMILNHQVHEAVERFVSPDFIEHNPNVKYGTLAGLIEYLDVEAIDVGRNTDSTMRIVVDRRFGGGEFVVTQHHVFRHEGDPGVVISDTFRVVGGKIVEHWDIHQDVPANKVNPLTMW